jgi:hypothetical protein
MLLVAPAFPPIVSAFRGMAFVTMLVAVMSPLNMVSMM